VEKSVTVKFLRSVFEVGTTSKNVPAKVEKKRTKNRERTNCMHPNRGNLTVGLKTETVGFVGLIFQRPQIFFSHLRQFSSDFDVSYHFGIRRPNKNH
jgi:hypothetical protein